MKLIIDIDDALVETARFAVRHDMGSDYVKSIANGIPLGKIRAEITKYKDDQIIHAERNEIIDIVLGIIDKYRNEVSEYGHMD